MLHFPWYSIFPGTPFSLVLLLLLVLPHAQEQHFHKPFWRQSYLPSVPKSMPYPFQLCEIFLHHPGRPSSSKMSLLDLDLHCCEQQSSSPAHLHQQPTDSLSHITPSTSATYRFSFPYHTIYISNLQILFPISHHLHQQPTDSLSHITPSTSATYRFSLFLTTPSTSASTSPTYRFYFPYHTIYISIYITNLQILFPLPHHLHHQPTDSLSHITPSTSAAYRFSFPYHTIYITNLQILFPISHHLHHQPTDSLSHITPSTSATYRFSFPYHTIYISNLQILSFPYHTIYISIYITNLQILFPLPHHLHQHLHHQPTDSLSLTTPSTSPTYRFSFPYHTIYISSLQILFPISHHLHKQPTDSLSHITPSTSATYRFSFPYHTICISNLQILFPISHHLHQNLQILSFPYHTIYISIYITNLQILFPLPHHLHQHLHHQPTDSLSLTTPSTSPTYRFSFPYHTIYISSL